MAMTKCRECGTEISDEAKNCPKCGIKNPAGGTSMLVKALGALLAIGFISSVFSDKTEQTATTQTQTAAVAPPPKDPKKEALKSVTIQDYQWELGGYNTVMMLDVKIKNAGPRDVKDLVIECTNTSNSGTQLAKNKITAFEVVKAGKSIRIRDLNMGFTHSQSARSSCSIIDLILI